jgi:hypothetical protein
MRILHLSLSKSVSHATRSGGLAVPDLRTQSPLSASDFASFNVDQDTTRSGKDLSMAVPKSSSFDPCSTAVFPMQGAAS